jgi:hypothetical protein
MDAIEEAAHSGRLRRLVEAVQELTDKHLPPGSGFVLVAVTQNGGKRRVDVLPGMEKDDAVKVLSIALTTIRGDS